MTQDTQPKCEQVLAYIAWHQREMGFPPSIRSICHACSIRSTASAHSYLLRLERQGKITRDPYKRQIKLTAETPYCPHDWRITNRDFVDTRTLLLECTTCHRRTEVESGIDWNEGGLETLPRYMGEVI